MLLLQARDLCKRYGNRELFTIPLLEIRRGDRVGVIGANGSGKTTLLDILAGETEPEKGTVLRLCAVAYIRQMGAGSEVAEDSLLGTFGIAALADATTRSGGEDTRVKIAQALSKNPALLFADEPTANLDSRGVELLARELRRVETLVIVSHDRTLLDEQCTVILELRDGKAQTYPGNFSAYRAWREAEKERAQFEYEEYAKERERLAQVAREKRQKAKSMTKNPKGMSNSEAKMRSLMMLRKPDVKEKNLAQAAKAVEKRLERLEVKERPKELPKMRLDFSLTDPPMGRCIARAENLSFAYGERAIFDGAAFELPSRARIALTGENGAGKTTLLRLIYEGHSSIWTAPKAHFGYFRQKMGDTDLEKSALDNVLRDAVQNEGAARSLLARLLFRGDDVYKPACVLSGGERIRLSLAMLLARPCNVLLLDEPTNYLDMPSIEAVQELLAEYEGTLLFVSHDSAFSQAVATASLNVFGGKLYADPTPPAHLAQGDALSSERLLNERLRAQLVLQFGDPSVDQAALKAQLKALDTLLR